MTAAQHSSKSKPPTMKRYFRPAIPTDHMVIENDDIALYKQWGEGEKKRKLIREAQASSLYGAALKKEVEELRQKVVELGGTLPSYYMNPSQLRNRIKTLEKKKAQGKKENNKDEKESFWTESFYLRHINELKRRKNNRGEIPRAFLPNFNAKGDNNKGNKGNKGKPMATTKKNKNPKNNNKNPKKTNKNPKKTNGR
tara:strand:- start:3165 stop:3755 length:591 start_codon:yes stop_codon:yes gene_type:complete